MKKAPAPLLLLLMALLPLTARCDFQYALSANQNLSAEQSQAASAWLQDAAAKLPPSMKNRLNRIVEVEFTDFGKQAFPSPQCTPDTDSDHVNSKPESRILGRTFSGLDAKHIQRIQIHSGFLPEILKGKEGSTSYPCGHGNIYALSLAVVLHETSHVYDFANFHEPSFFAEQKKCHAEWVDKASHISTHCKNILTIDHSISQDPVMQNLLGAKELLDPLPMRRTNEISSLRSPDIYEFTNTEEGFAVNMEFFLLDPEYACRRPSLHRELAQHFQFDPFPQRSCKINTQFPVQFQEITGNSLVTMMDLNPQRLYAIHYLLVEPGNNSIANGFGHTMLRFVFCSPAHPVPGPDCLKDITYHVVASFRANITDTQIDKVKSMLGDYPSMLFLVPLTDVLREYASINLQDLQSIPLLLSPEQQEQLLYRSLELGWEYRSRYFYIGNNCAGETIELLKDIIHDSALQENYSIFPVELLQKLVKLGYADNKVLLDRKKAIHDGYLFPAKSDRLKNAFDKIKTAAGAQLQFQDLDSYVSKSSAEQRLKLDSILQKQYPEISAYFFILESRILDLQSQNFTDELTKLLYGDSGKELKDQAAGEAANELRLIRKQLLPASLTLKKEQIMGYGIAQAQDLDQLEDTINNKAASYEKSEAFLSNWIKEHAPTEREKLKSIMSNRQKFLSEIK